MAYEKEPVAKIFCLFHQKIECSCIYPILNQLTLSERLKHRIRLNNLLNRHEPNAEIKDKRNQETILFENRLSDLKE